MVRINHANILKDALEGTGFVRRGSAFFRVWGDGVLQVLKFERERGDRVPDLRIGIFSMYGNLLAQWFTSGGCIPRGSVVEFIGLRDVDGWILPNRLTRTDDDQFLYRGIPVSIDPTMQLLDPHGELWSYYVTVEQQIRIFREKVLPWLNDMTTQSLAAKGMYKIHPVLNDSLRFDAHLASGEWTQAEQAMGAILKQHGFALSSWEHSESPERFAQMVTQQNDRDAFLWAAYGMVKSKNREAISAYLNENYSRNCELAKFCMKKGRNTPLP